MLEMRGLESAIVQTAVQCEREIDAVRAEARAALQAQAHEGAREAVSGAGVARECCRIAIGLLLDCYRIATGLRLDCDWIATGLLLDCYVIAT